MNPLRALLVDDERLARKRLATLLERHPVIRVAGEADGMADAAAKMQELQPDVVFLDIEMPPGNGLDLILKQSGKEATKPSVVFVTAYDHFAVQAFDVCAVDYLLKPVHPDRLAMTVQRLEQAVQGVPEMAQEGWTLDSQVELGDRQTRRLVPIKDIVAIHALGAYTRVSLREDNSLVVLRGMADWERALPAEAFARIDRSSIIHTKLLRKIERKSRNESLLSFEGMTQRLSIGRAATSRLRKVIAGDMPPGLKE
ncbi:LytR/AlgR family response regulator transcription factor [Haloferula sargassicola]|uniref:Transcriptional regulatory protein YpdB n=1 Tax=Haloferula sargassicola TaxID=490096 RepID=A0ABP9UPL5_9BACT